MDQSDSQRKTYLRSFITAALREDVGGGDFTSVACIPPGSTSKGRLLIKDDGVIAGVEVAEQIFRHVDPGCKFHRLLHDGDSVSFGATAFEVECNTRALLKAERLALNVMQRMSGIATLSNRFAFEVEDQPVKILDTRKTTPLIRFLEKWAVQLGGCHNYRFGLFDWFMIKDNHIEACGGVQRAIEKVEKFQIKKGLHLGVTVEVKTLNQLDEVLRVGKVTRIMFDNFELPLLHTAVAMVDKRYETEASGGITINNVRKVAQAGVDYISAGALTHSAQSLDLSLKIFS
jgi:nicotinate-nucleotide pyrophosphorylase (carboxylating)